MIKIKSTEQIARMRTSGRMAAQVLTALIDRVGPGVTTKDLDDYAFQMIRELGGISAFIGYHGYPGHICVSINEEVVHGIPGPRRIQLGDIVSIDVGVRYDGFVGDTAKTVAVGLVDADVRRLLTVAEKSLEEAITKAVVGGRLSDISHAVESTVVADGFSVVRQYVGHGVGQDMHEEPQIPNFGPPGKGPKLKAGMTLAIEPMVNLGGCEVDVLADGWTVVTRDRRPSAHFEHTIAVMDGGAEILTCVSPK